SVPLCICYAPWRLCMSVRGTLVRHVPYLGFSLAIALVSCSKGGLPDQDLSCAKLADLTQTESTLPALPKMLYAELRGTPAGGGTGTSIGVMLSGSGGIYSGMY